MSRDALPPSTLLTGGAEDDAPRGALFEDTPALSPGESIGRFLVEARVGEGGVATVYRVRHKALGSPYALKVLRLRRPHLGERLLAEGRLQARLQHPNIVRVHDVLDVGGLPALLMDLVEGPSLSRWMGHQRPPLAVAEALFRGILAGVAHAHAHGVVHRDLKPANVLLADGPSGLVPRVTDFGIARFLYDDAHVADLTRTGLVLGTPAYMAPEQLRSTGTVDTRADLFALGVLLYELCCGARPFQGDDLLSLMGSLDRGEYLPPEALRPDLPMPLRTAIAACLVGAPEDRVPDCAALAAILDGAPWVPRPAAPRRSIHSVEAPGAEGDHGPPSLATRAAPARVSRGLAAGAAAALILSIALGAALLHTRGESQAQAARAYGDRLLARAWQVAETDPAASLALLQAAGVDRREAPATTLELARLAERGAAVKVIDAGAQVVAAALSPDGARIAGGLLGGDLAVWDRRTGARQFQVSAGAGWMIDRLAFSPDASRIYVIPERGVFGGDGAIPARSFDAATGQTLLTFAHGPITMDLKQSVDGRWAVTLGKDDRVQGWDLSSGAPTYAFDILANVPESCVALSPDSRWLAAPSAPDRVLIRAVDSGTVRAEVAVEPMGSCTLAFPSADSLLVIREEGAATFTLDGAPIARLGRALGALREVSAVSGLLVAGTGEDRLEVFRLPDLTSLGPLEDAAAPLLHLALSEDGATATAATVDGDVVTWDLAARAIIQEGRGHTSRIMSVATAGRGRAASVVTSSRDHTVRVWEIAPASLGGYSLDDPARRTLSIGASDDLGVVVRARDGGVLEVRGPDGAALTAPVHADITRTAAMAVGHRGGIAATYSSRGRVDVFGLSPLRLLASLPVAKWLRWLVFSPDDTLVAGLSDHSDLLLARQQDGWQATQVRLPSLPFRATWREDGERLYIGGRAGELLTVDPLARAVLRTDVISADPTGISALTALDGGALLAIGDFEGSGWIWDPEASATQAPLQGHTDAVVGFAAAPGGGPLLSVGWDRTVRLWDAETFALRDTLAGLGADPTRVAVSPDGARFAVGTRDGQVLVGDLGQRLTLRAVHRVPSLVLGLSFSPDGAELRALTARDALWRWDAAARTLDPATPAAVTNLRVCPGTTQVVPLTPWPAAQDAFAPAEACGETQ